MKAEAEAAARPAATRGFPSAQEWLELGEDCRVEERVLRVKLESLASTSTARKRSRVLRELDDGCEVVVLLPLATALLGSVVSDRNGLRKWAMRLTALVRAHAGDGAVRQEPSLAHGGAKGAGPWVADAGALFGALAHRA